jgi:arsenite/tail-anchored protein-transporting ATPase
MLTPHLTLGTRWTFVGGKGGVGKTTVAAALAVELADAGERVLVLSVDPAHSLADALGTELGSEPSRVAGNLEAMEVSASSEQARFLDRHGPEITSVIERGTYLDAEDVDLVSELAVPGIDELAALIRLAELAKDHQGRMVVDTAPTGHTIRLLELPRLAMGWLAALEAMEAKHAAIATAFAGVPPRDSVTGFLDDFRANLESLSETLADPSATRFVLVTTPEPVVMAETLRFADRLASIPIASGGMVVNRIVADGVGPNTGAVRVPLLLEPLGGLDGLRHFAARAGRGANATATREDEGRPASPQVGAVLEPPLDRALYIVAGKGGVGKSTAAAALAVHLARTGSRRVLLLSVDPAGSLGEILEIPVGATLRQVPGVAGLDTRQLDPESAWAEYRARYSEEVEALFGGLLAEGMTVAYDQRIVQQLIDLAPPGLDELVAILEVIDVTEDLEYDALVLDTAPTGHLLRLLEMPEVALDWCHAVMRLLLKYREAIPLGRLGEEVLRLARSIRALRDRLGDPMSTWVLVVALPESLSVPETRRLLVGLRERDVSPGAVLINRSLDDLGRLVSSRLRFTTELAAIEPDLPIAAAPETAPPPTGVERLHRFLGAWRQVLGPVPSSGPPGG